MAKSLSREIENRKEDQAEIFWHNNTILKIKSSTDGLNGRMKETFFKTSKLEDTTIEFGPVQFSCSVMSNSVTPWTAACQASLSITLSQSLLKFMSIESMMPSNHLILCHPPSPTALNLSQIQGLFQWVGPSHQVAKVLELQLQQQSFQWIIRVDFL